MWDNNLPACFPFPSRSEEHPTLRSDAIGTQAIQGAAPALCVRANVPGTCTLTWIPCPTLS